MKVGFDMTFTHDEWTVTDVTSSDKDIAIPHKTASPYFDIQGSGTVTLQVTTTSKRDSRTHITTVDLSAEKAMLVPCTAGSVSCTASINLPHDLECQSSATALDNDSFGSYVDALTKGGFDFFKSGITTNGGSTFSYVGLNDTQNSTHTHSGTKYSSGPLIEVLCTPN